MERARGGDRTHDLTFTRGLLSPLSYSGRPGVRADESVEALPTTTEGLVARGSLLRDTPDAKVRVMALSKRERAILEVERSWWASPDAPATKGRAIRERLGLSPARYYQLLSALIDRAEADAYDPLVVRRVRRARDARRRARYEGPSLDEGSRR